jgi:hypothetical protein
MSGLILLAVVVPLVLTLALLAAKVASKAEQPWLRSAIKWSVLLVLLTLPFVDEIIGKYQFEALCKANGIESADISRARGKRVKVEYGERRFVDGTIMPIKESDVRFKDADSGEVLIQHKNYYALGGWLMRSTPLSMGSPQPMLFGGSTCDRWVEQAIFKANSITLSYK